MGRRPTIQTTVTASLTKSSLGACNQMSLVKFASKCVSSVTFKKCKAAKGEFTEIQSHWRCLLLIHPDGALHQFLMPPLLHCLHLLIHPSSIYPRCSLMP